MIRVGAVNYLNSKPLIEGLADHLPDGALRLDYPSRLATDLWTGLLDVALVPSIACLLEPDYEVVTDACVAARGQVLSVKLYSRVPPDRIRTLALDAGSRTSATLTRVLLAERFGILPRIESLPLASSTADSRADAVLLIGDRAMFAPPETFVETWDLAEEWTRLTGLPFVFAMWATRRGADLRTVEEQLVAARDRGERRLEQIGRREAGVLGLPVAVAIDYLTQNLYYRLGPAERQGLLRFHELAIQHDLAPKGIDLVFRTPAAA